MKKHSKVLLSLALAAMFLPLFESCKKGEEDPGLSLKSRKGRVAGDWVLGIFDVTSTSTTDYDDPDTGNDGDIVEVMSSSTESWDGTAYTYNETSKSTTDVGDFTEDVTTASGGTIEVETTTKSGSTTVTSTLDGTYTYSNTTSYTFEKDGTFSMSQATNRTIIFEESEDGYDLTQTMVEDENTTSTGRWAFIGKDKSGEFKNKERIAIWIDSQNTTQKDSDDQDYTDTDPDDFTDYEDFSSLSEDTWTSTWTGMDTDPDMVWELIRLAGDEMKAMATWTSTSDGENESSFTQGSTTTTTTTSSTTTSDYTMTMTLTQE